MSSPVEGVCLRPSCQRRRVLIFVIVLGAREETQETRNTRFLELCIDTNDYSKLVGEIDVTNVNSDRDLFQEIINTYICKREKRSMTRVKTIRHWSRLCNSKLFQWSFTKPSSVIFRRVSHP